MKNETLELLLLAIFKAIVIVACVVAIVQIIQDEPGLLLVIMVATIMVIGVYLII